MRMRYRNSITMVAVILLAIASLIIYDINGIAAGEIKMKSEMDREMQASRSRIIFATYADDNNDLYWARLMGESIRSFGGSLKDSPIEIYLAKGADDWDPGVLARIDSLMIEIKRCDIPTDVRQFPYSNKVFAAGAAERGAESRAEIIAWLDPDMVFVGEPREFLLNDESDFGYRPVQLVNISSPVGKPPDEYWSRIYNLLGIPDSAAFTMTTTVDNIAIRPHFNAGMIVVRPEKRLLRQWGDNFRRLAADSTLIELCEQGQLRNIYLHQAALAATILISVPHNLMYDLPATYNYAVFLTEKMADKSAILALDNVVMFRHGQHYISLAKLQEYAGSSKIFQWLKDRWRE